MTQESRIASLERFFKENVPVRAMQSFNSVIDDLQYIPAQKDLGLDQYRLAIIRSSAVLAWEQFPFRECDPRLLLALLTVWLANHDDRDLFRQAGVTGDSPQWDISVDDERTATVVLTVPLIEELCITKDVNGAIPFDGCKWRLAVPDLWIASSGNVFTSRTEG